MSEGSLSAASAQAESSTKRLLGKLTALLIFTATLFVPLHLNWAAALTKAGYPVMPVGSAGFAQERGKAAAIG